MKLNRKICAGHLPLALALPIIVVRATTGHAGGDAGERYLSGILAATYSLPLTAEVRGFAELAGRDLRSERHGGNQLTFDTGVTDALDRDTQLDAAINLGLNRFTPDSLFTLGFSRRFR